MSSDPGSVRVIDVDLLCFTAHGSVFSVNQWTLFSSLLRASHLHLSQHRRDSVEQKHGDGRRNVKNVERRDQESSELRPLLHLCTPGCCSDGEYHT